MGEGTKLNEKISDSKWFFLSWKKDPTIKAMLTMLDAIEEKLKDKKKEEDLANREASQWNQRPAMEYYSKGLNPMDIVSDQ